MTVTVKVQALVLALASVAVQVTVVVPSGNIEPLAGLQLMLEPEQLSLAVATKVTCAWQSPLTLSAPVLVVVVMLAGQVAVGGWLSFTVTVKLHVAVWPEVSVAVQSTVVVPLAKVEPLAGVQLVVTPGQLSLAAGAAQLTTAEQTLGSVFFVILVGQVIAGFSLSLTVTLKLQEAVLPLASVTVQVTVLLPLAKVEPLAGLQLTVWPGQLSAPVGVV